MKVVAYTPLHYGKDYLWWAIASVANYVDRHFVLYTPKPSYGHGTDLVCPDTRDELHEIAVSFPHVRWYEATYSNESQHRDAVMHLIPADTDILLPVDADEVWAPTALRSLLDTIGEVPIGREIRLHGFRHVWKSFGYECVDNMLPVRVLDLRCLLDTKAYATGEIWHFGYCQGYELMRYKWAIHGHKNELRTDYDWLEMYRTWEYPRGDVHPTCKDTWFPRPVDRCLMPALVTTHPLFNEEAWE